MSNAQETKPTTQLAGCVADKIQKVGKGGTSPWPLESPKIAVTLDDFFNVLGCVNVPAYCPRKRPQAVQMNGIREDPHIANSHPLEHFGNMHHLW